MEPVWWHFAPRTTIPSSLLSLIHNRCCLALVGEVGEWLGLGLSNLAAALDPGMFVIGGGLSDAGELLLEPARRAYARNLTGRGFRPEARIEKAALGPEAGLIGAADLSRVAARR